MSTATERPRSAVPGSPWSLGLREWRAAVVGAGRGFLRDDCIGLAKEIAYGAILAFAPTMIVLVAAFALLDVYTELRDFLGVVAPDAVLDALAAAEGVAERRGASVVALVVGIVGAGWAASGAMAATMKAVNRAYNQQERRPFWKQRLIALGLVLATALITASVLLLIVFGEPLGEAIAAQAGLGEVFELTWSVLRWPIAFAAILIFLAVVYYVAPTLDQRSWRWVSPGSVVAGTAWLLISYAFSLYTRIAGNYDETYGPLAGAIVFLLWLNFSAMALLFGAELNAEVDRQADVRAAGGPRAGLTERARRSR